MNIELRIQADSLEEIAHIFAAKAAAYQPNFGERPETVPTIETAREAEPEEAVAPKPRRGKGKSDAAKSTEPSSKEGQEPGTATTASPSDEKVTLDDLRAAAEPIMAAGKGRDIQEMLLAKFNVRAFGPLPEESYPAALAELQNLAA